MKKGGSTELFTLSVNEYLDECPGDINRMAWGLFEEIDERIQEAHDGYCEWEHVIALLDRMVEVFEKAKTDKRFKTPLNDEMKATYEKLLEYRKELPV